MLVFDTHLLAHSFSLAQQMHYYLREQGVFTQYVYNLYMHLLL